MTKEKTIIHSMQDLLCLIKDGYKQNNEKEIYFYDEAGKEYIIKQGKIYDNKVAAKNNICEIGYINYETQMILISNNILYSNLLALCKTEEEKSHLKSNKEVFEIMKQRWKTLFKKQIEDELTIITYDNNNSEHIKMYNNLYTKLKQFILSAIVSLNTDVDNIDVEEFFENIIGMPINEEADFKINFSTMPAYFDRYVKDYMFANEDTFLNAYEKYFDEIKKDTSYREIIYRGEIKKINNILFILSAIKNNKELNKAVKISQKFHQIFQNEGIQNEYDIQVKIKVKDDEDFEDEEKTTPKLKKMNIKI